MSFGDVENLKEPLRSQVKAAMAAVKGGKVSIPPPPPPAGCPRSRRRIAGPKKQTATEQAYNRECLGGLGEFEAIGFKLPGGSRYTPDFYVPAITGLEVHEVKGGHRFASQSRAVMAFREAAAIRPEFRFVWAERQKGGGWLIMFDSMDGYDGNKEKA